MRVLLAEDDELLGDGIKKGLNQKGYVVDWFKDGLTVVQALKTETFDMVILDLGLPNVDGLEILQSVRHEGIRTPILILTARDTIEDRVKGLDEGADDYLTKPFDLDELYARLRALQRRSTHRSENQIIHDKLVLNPESHSVIFDNQPVTLPRREFALLHKLLENAGLVLSREQLSQSLYGWKMKLIAMP